jgi:hypothetical protein
MLLTGTCGWIPMPRGPSRVVPGGKRGRVPALVPILPGPSRVIPVGTDDTDDQVLMRVPIPPNPPRMPPIFIGDPNLPIEIACTTSPPQIDAIVIAATPVTAHRTTVRAPMRSQTRLQ